MIPMATVTEFLASAPLSVLGLRMALVAGFVVLVAVVAERTGPFLGAMIASLPLSAGPIYVMLALDHDADWIGQAMLGSIAICGATPAFIIAYCLLARRHGAPASIAGALLSWLAVALIVQARAWTLPEALLFVVPVNVSAAYLGRHFTRGVAPARVERRRSDLAVRAVLCAALAGFVIGVSNAVPAQVSGVLSLTPILLTSVAIVLHSRTGGAPTAALLAHSLTGLIGMVIAFSVAHVSIDRIGVWPALGAGLAVAVAWNLLLIALRGILARGRA
jgi:hypothetical protein